MIRMNTSTVSFELQARTELATSQSGLTTNATVFSAFAAKDQTGSSIQIEMSQDKKSNSRLIFIDEKVFHNTFVIDFFSFINLDMTINANGKDLTKQFENANYTVLTSNISIRWDNGKISALFLKPCK